MCRGRRGGSEGDRYTLDPRSQCATTLLVPLQLASTLNSSSIDATPRWRGAPARRDRRMSFGGTRGIEFEPCLGARKGHLFRYFSLARLAPGGVAWRKSAVAVGVSVVACAERRRGAALMVPASARILRAASLRFVQCPDATSRVVKRRSGPEPNGFALHVSCASFTMTSIGSAARRCATGIASVPITPSPQTDSPSCTATARA